MNCSNPYPTHRFHRIIENTASEIHNNVQAPAGLIGMSLLSSISIACQGLIDVQLPTGQVRPVSLYLMVIADSGERKTAVDTLTAAPLYRFDEQNSKRYEEEMTKYKAKHSTWQSIARGLKRKLTKAAESGGEYEEFSERLTEHQLREPSKPRHRRLIRQNATDRAMMDALQGDGESLAFLSDEGEIILKGGAMAQLGRLNKGWDGAKEITIDRANDEAIIAREPRITFALMVQQAVLQTYIEKKGSVARGSGHWARYLVAWPESTQGFRFIQTLEKTWNHLPAFHSRLTELLEEYREKRLTGSIGRMVIEFSEEAKGLWIFHSNQIEQTLQPWGYFKDMQDFASKSLEIAGRLAALFHHFSKQEGKISYDTFQRALDFIYWHLNEFKKIFTPSHEPPQAQTDAQALLGYLTTFFQSGTHTISKNYVLRNGPIRPAQRMRDALDYLALQGKICTFQDAKRTMYIRYNHTLPVLQTRWTR